MTRPPRDPRAPLFGRRLIVFSLLQGASVLAIVMIVFVMALLRGRGELEARALTFTTLIVSNLALILTNRSWSRGILSTLRSPNPALWWIISGALAILGLVLYVPAWRALFRFATLHPDDLMMCLAAGAVSIAWCEWLKMLRAPAVRSQPPP